MHSQIHRTTTGQKKHMKLKEPVKSQKNIQSVTVRNLTAYRILKKSFSSASATFKAKYQCPSQYQDTTLNYPRLLPSRSNTPAPNVSTEVKEENGGCGLTLQSYVHILVNNPEEGLH